LLACSTYVLVRLLLFLPRLFAQSFDWSDVRANIIPAAISFLVTSLLIMIAVNLCEDPSSDWFRTQGAVVRYAFLVLGAVSLYEWAWIAVVVWLWWLSAGIMACHAGLTRT
jgi:amino acid transporter